MSESQVFNLTIPGQPVGWKRVDYNNQAGHRVMFDPKENVSYKKLIRDYAFAAGVRGNPPHEGPVRINLECFLQRPKRLMRHKDPEGPVICISKPDSDNLIKIVKDALNKYAYRDDAQVYEESVRKMYCEKGEGPRTLIRLELMPWVD